MGGWGGIRHPKTERKHYFLIGGEKVVVFCEAGCLDPEPRSDALFLF